MYCKIKQVRRLYQVGHCLRLILGIFKKICRENPNLLKIGQFIGNPKYFSFLYFLNALLVAHETTLV